MILHGFESRNPKMYLFKQNAHVCVRNGAGPKIFQNSQEILSAPIIQNLTYGRVMALSQGDHPAGPWSFRPGRVMRLASSQGDGECFRGFSASCCNGFLSIMVCPGLEPVAKSQTVT